MLITGSGATTAAPATTVAPVKTTQPAKGNICVPCRIKRRLKTRPYNSYIDPDELLLSVRVLEHGSLERVD